MTAPFAAALVVSPSPSHWDRQTRTFNVGSDFVVGRLFFSPGQPSLIANAPRSLLVEGAASMSNGRVFVTTWNPVALNASPYLGYVEHRNK